jgi:hypothetical protein
MERSMTLQEIAWPFESEAIALEEETRIVPLEQAVRRWVDTNCGPGLAARALYQLDSEEFVVADTDGQRCLRSSRLRPRDAYLFLRMIHAEIPPDVFQVNDSDQWLNMNGPPRALNHWCGKGRLQPEAIVSAHEVQLPDVLSELMRVGIRVVQHYRDANLERQTDEHEILGPMVGALFERYPVDPSQWWGSKNRIPPAHVGVLELQWPAGTDDLRSVVRNLQNLLKPPISWIMWCGRNVDNPEAPTYLEREIANLAIRLRIPQLEMLLVELRRRLEGLNDGTTLGDLRENQRIRTPSSDAFLAYEIRELTGAKQEDIARLICQFTGGTTEQGTVSRWLGEVDRWISQGNLVPPCDRSLLRNSFKIRGCY